MNGILWKEEEEEEKEDQTQMLTLEIVVSPAHTQFLSQSKKMNERKENLAYVTGPKLALHLGEREGEQGTVWAVHHLERALCCFQSQHFLRLLTNYQIPIFP